MSTCLSSLIFKRCLQEEPIYNPPTRLSLGQCLGLNSGRPPGYEGVHCPIFDLAQDLSLPRAGVPWHSQNWDWRLETPGFGSLLGAMA